MVFIGHRDVDLEPVLDELGLDVVERGDNLLCRCPFHDDQRRSFAISERSGAWICYAGCGEGGLAKLVSRSMNVDIQTAYSWLEERGSAGGSEEMVMKMISFDEPDQEKRLNLFSYEQGLTYRYMTNRGFTTDTLKDWSVGKDSEEHAVVIPVCFEQEVVGLIRRYIYPEATIPYRFTEALPKSKILFGWDHLPDVPHQIIVTEGALDAMWLHQHHYPGVALLGNRLSGAQADLLVGRTREVLLALDSDLEGQRGNLQAIKRLVGRVAVRVVAWPSGKKDAQECDSVELMRSMAEPLESSIWAAGVV